MAGDERGVSLKRRQFLLESARSAGAAALLVQGLSVYAKRSAALPAYALRPPGARAESEFLGACVRCGLCVRDCPYGTLDLARLGEDVATGTPYFGARALLRVRAPRRAQCNNCMDCFAVCPEPQVITPVLKGEDKGVRPTILDPACTACGRCIDVCSRDVFEVGTRLTDRRRPASPTAVTLSGTPSPAAAAARVPSRVSANR